MTTPETDSIVIIPTYNEKENAAAIIDAVISQPHKFDILVIDDGSPDGTAAIVRSKMEQYPGRVNIIERSGKLGLGTAYLTGFRTMDMSSSSRWMPISRITPPTSTPSTVPVMTRVPMWR